MNINKNWAVLVVRLIIGGIFIAAGWVKASDFAMTVGFFDQLGIAAFIAYVVTYAEIIGGVLIVLGLWTEVAALVLAVIMAFAIFYSRMAGFQGVMGPLAVFAGLVSLMASGAGHYTVRRRG